MRKAKNTGKKQRVTEPECIGDIKVSVTIPLDLDLLNKIKHESEAQAVSYQDLIILILREYIDLLEIRKFPKS